MSEKNSVIAMILVKINPPKKSMCEVKMSLIEGKLSIGIIPGLITFAIRR